MTSCQLFSLSSVHRLSSVATVMFESKKRELTASPARRGHVQLLHSRCGAGITIAVLDTAPRYTTAGIHKDSGNDFRIHDYHDAINDLVCSMVAQKTCPDDAYGHGTHVTGVAVSSETTDLGDFAGVAPDAGLVIVRAIGDQGSGTLRRRDPRDRLGGAAPGRARHGPRACRSSTARSSAPPRRWRSTSGSSRSSAMVLCRSQTLGGAR